MKCWSRLEEAVQWGSRCSGDTFASGVRFRVMRSLIQE